MKVNAVYTFWETSERIVNSGFNNTKEMAQIMALSLEYSKKYFDKVILVTNDYGKELLIDTYKLPYDEVVFFPEEMDQELDGNLWAFAKIEAYKLMSERGVPFVHIDNDVILWKPLDEKLLSTPLFFQNKEKLCDFLGYNYTLGLMKECPFVPSFVYDYKAEWAFCCGIVGVNRFDIVLEWYNEAKHWIHAPENKEWWSKQTDKHSKNHMFEQYFISCLIKKHGIVEETGVLMDDFSLAHLYDKQDKITHLWGESKKNKQTMNVIAKILYKRYPEYIRFESVKPNHREVFTNIYKRNLWDYGSGYGSIEQNTGEYREFLAKFMKEKEVKTIVDLGCGDWKINKLMDWSGKKIIGVDIVPSIMKHNKENYSSDNVEFIVKDIRNYVIPPCDLLIIKDTFIHWKNEEIIKFLIKDIPAKYILVTEDTRVKNHNIDNNETGGYRDVDITKAPFNIKAELVFKWTNLPKSTYLICQT